MGRKHEKRFDYLRDIGKISTIIGAIQSDEDRTEEWRNRAEDVARDLIQVLVTATKPENYKNGNRPLRDPVIPPSTQQQ